MRRIKVWAKFKAWVFGFSGVGAGAKAFPDENNHSILLPNIPYTTWNYVRLILF